MLSQNLPTSTETCMHVCFSSASMFRPVATVWLELYDVFGTQLGFSCWRPAIQLIDWNPNSRTLNRLAYPLYICLRPCLIRTLTHAVCGMCAFAAHGAALAYPQCQNHFVRSSHRRWSRNVFLVHNTPENPVIIVAVKRSRSDCADSIDIRCEKSGSLEKSRLNRAPATSAGSAITYAIVSHCSRHGLLQTGSSVSVRPMSFSDGSGAVELPRGVTCCLGGSVYSFVLGINKEADTV